MKIRRWPALPLLILTLMLATHSRNNLWKTPLTLWQDTARSKPNSARVRNNLGNSYALAGRIPEAVEEYRLAIQLDPSHVETYYNLGTLYEKNNRPQEAMQYFQLFCSMAPVGPLKASACERASFLSRASK